MRHPSQEIAASLVIGFHPVVNKAGSLLNQGGALRRRSPARTLSHGKGAKVGFSDGRDSSGLVAAYSSFDNDDHEEAQIAREARSQAITTLRALASGALRVLQLTPGSRMLTRYRSTRERQTICRGPKIAQCFRRPSSCMRLPPLA